MKENSFICIVGFPLAVCNDDTAFLNSKPYNLQFHKIFLGNLKVLARQASLKALQVRRAPESLSLVGHHSLAGY